MAQTYFRWRIVDITLDLGYNFLQFVEVDMKLSLIMIKGNLEHWVE